MGDHDPYSFYQAILARIAAIPLDVGDNEALPNKTTPHAVLYVLDEEDDPEDYGTLTDPHIGTRFMFQVTAVGLTAAEARFTQSRIRSQLIGWIPTVTGMVCGQVERDGGVGVQREDDTKPPRFSAIDRFACFASNT